MKDWILETTTNFIT